MTPASEREVIQFTVSLNTNPVGRFNDIEPLAEQIVHDAKLGNCVALIDAARMQIGLSDARIVRLPSGEKALAMLFDLTDPFATVPANRHMRTRAVRLFEKQEDEGRAVSAHLLMALRSIDGSRRYRALLEHSLGLGQSRIKPHIQRILRRIFDEQGYTVEDGDGRDVPAKPVFGMDAVRSDRLEESVADSEISELVLIHSSVPKGQFDSPDAVRVIRREMRVSVAKTMTHRFMDVIDAIRPWARESGYNQVYVRWRRRSDEAALETRSKVQYNRATIDLRNADLGETLFAKRHFVTLDHDMVDCVESLRDDMIDRMIQLL